MDQANDYFLPYIDFKYDCKGYVKQEEYNAEFQKYTLMFARIVVVLLRKYLLAKHPICILFCLTMYR